MWMEEQRGVRVNAERTRQALETGAEGIATACPFCLVMMRDGLADSAANASRNVEAQDIAEIMAGRLTGARVLPVVYDTKSSVAQ
jgi:Fe-S oxidoreductase